MNPLSQETISTDHMVRKHMRASRKGSIYTLQLLTVLEAECGFASAAAQIHPLLPLAAHHDWTKRLANTWIGPSDPLVHELVR